MRTGPLFVVTALLLALAACVPTGGHPSASPSASATPVFASDAEALAAAEKAYAAYLKVSDEIANDGGKDPDRIVPFVTKGRLKTELDGAAAYVSRGIHTVGTTAFRNASLQQSATTADETEVVIYACWVASAVRVINASGKDVTPTNRVDSQTLEVVMTTVGGHLPLVLESDNSWSGSSSC